MSPVLGPIERRAIGALFRARLAVDTPGRGFTDLTGALARFLREAGAGDGVLSAFVRHTSASLTVQENADPDVRADLLDALTRLAPEGMSYRHDAEGPDDMPAHVRTMLTDASLVVPVAEGRMTLGTWQAIYLVEHRAQPHRREIELAFIGSQSGSA